MEYTVRDGGLVVMTRERIDSENAPAPNKNQDPGITEAALKTSRERFFPLTKCLFGAINF